MKITWDDKKTITRQTYSQIRQTSGLVKGEERERGGILRLV